MKKKLKPLRHRKPKQTTTVKDMTKYIKDETGFREDDILLVIRAMIKFVKEMMLNKIGVSLPKLGIFYPLIKPARIVMSMNGGVGTPTKMTMSDRWQIKFKSSESVDKLLESKTPTQEEIDEMYIN